uniref:Uncharacterized protein n=1 Tax=Peronospora matthiolae TaxID=2874970 RepID=A0AAV1VNV0_9STRA
MRSGWTGNFLLSALSPATAYEIYIAANTARGSRAKLKFEVQVETKFKDEDMDAQDTMQGAVG